MYVGFAASIRSSAGLYMSYRTSKLELEQVKMDPKQCLLGEWMMLAFIKEKEACFEVKAFFPHTLRQLQWSFSDFKGK